MKDFKKYIAPLLISLGLLILALGILTKAAHATPSGGYGQPFYTKTQQGKSIVYGRATCKSAGAVAFAVSASGAQSIIMRNAGPGYLSGMFLKADDALVLDKATTVTSGWKCWASTDTPLNFFAEQ